MSFIFSWKDGDPNFGSPLSSMSTARDESGSNGFLEEADEQLSNDECDNHDEYHWDPHRAEFVGILGSIFHNQIACASIKANNSEDSDEDEHACESVSEVELDQVPH